VSDPPVTTLIVDDEPLARRTLRSLVSRRKWLALAGEACNGDEALTAIETLRPELVFLDIRMPGRSGIDVLRSAKHEPIVVLTTAFDEYALVAYELGAIDYLVKPFSDARFDRALERALPRIEAVRLRSKDSPDSSLIARIERAHAQPDSIDTIFVRERGSVVPVAVADVTRFEADGDFVAVHARGQRHLVYLNLGDLAARLDPARFVRVHRSHIVRLAAIAAVSAADPNRAELRMSDGARIVASRAGTRALRARMQNAR
jgi:two-component system LytT family response regulator